MSETVVMKKPLLVRLGWWCLKAVIQGTVAVLMSLFTIHMIGAFTEPLNDQAHGVAFWMGFLLYMEWLENRFGECNHR